MLELLSGPWKGLCLEGKDSLNSSSFKINPSFPGPHLRSESLRRVEMCMDFVLFQNFSRWVLMANPWAPPHIWDLLSRISSLPACLLNSSIPFITKGNYVWHWSRPHRHKDRRRILLPWGARGLLESWARNEFHINCLSKFCREEKREQTSARTRGHGLAEGLTLARSCHITGAFPSSRKPWKNTVSLETNQSHSCVAEEEGT